MTQTHYQILGVSPAASDTELKAAYRRLARQFHPDQNPGNKLAEEKFKNVAIAYAVLSDPSKRAHYDRFGDSAPIVIPSKRGKYKIERQIHSGGLADIYQATREADGRSVVLKIARSPQVNDLLANEGARLKALFPLADDPMKAGVRYLPKYHDSFLVDDGTRRQVNVLDFLSDFGSMARIREMFPGGVLLEHAVWMFNRLLEGLDYIHRQGFFHGALVPSNAMVWLDPNGHLVKAIDFTASGKIGEPIKFVAPAWRHFYPAEVFAKKPATAATDLFMAARLAQYLSLIHI